MKNFLQLLQASKAKGQKMMSILIDPDKFDEDNARKSLSEMEKHADFLLLGGSTDEFFKTKNSLDAIRKATKLPVVLFPGDYNQITPNADALLFLSLISGRNPEYLIGQQVKSISKLKNLNLEIIPTGYILIDGGKETAVERVSQTKPMPQDDLQAIVDTALAGQFLGMQAIYLEAGSGAKYPVAENIIEAVKSAIEVPLFVGGGIRSIQQQRKAYEAGADVVVVGTAFEDGSFQL